MCCRKVAIVNLDPANEHIPYPCAVNVADLITLDDTMQELGLGPNGGIMFCLEYLLENIDWLTEKLEELKDHYILFDYPGQVELFTHHTAVKQILDKLQKLDYRVREEGRIERMSTWDTDRVSTACSRSSRGCTLLHRSIKVHFRATAISQDNDPT